MRRRKSAENPRIEIVPMIDVMFFLLIFFIFWSLGAQHQTSLPVSIPKTTQEDQGMAPYSMLTLGAEGEIWINDSQINEDQFEALLSQSFQVHAQQPLFVQADERVPYGRVMQFVEKARALGIRKFQMALERSGDGGG